jgi:hypothetical protein
MSDPRDGVVRADGGSIANQIAGAGPVVGMRRPTEFNDASLAFLDRAS